MRLALKPNRRRLGVTIATAFLASLMLGTSIGAANAGTAVSALGYYTISGNEYVSQAAVVTSTGSAYACTQNRLNNSPTPVGWAGSRGRLFTSGGSLSCEGSNTYNSVTGGSGVGFSCTRSSSGTWYSYGVALGWNGSGYTSFYTFTSPNQSS